MHVNPQFDYTPLLVPSGNDNEHGTAELRAEPVPLEDVVGEEVFDFLMTDTSFF